MKINEVEAAVGVTKKNIRFYEEEGLISPRREPGNGYRSYSRGGRGTPAPHQAAAQAGCAAGRDPADAGRASARWPRVWSASWNVCAPAAPTWTKPSASARDCSRNPAASEELDVEQTLARLTAREEQGVTFVNIERYRPKSRAHPGGLVGAALLVAMMLLSWASWRGPFTSTRRMRRRCRCWWCCSASRRAASWAR